MTKKEYIKIISLSFAEELEIEVIRGAKYRRTEKTCVHSNTHS